MKNVENFKKVLLLMLMLSSFSSCSTDDNAENEGVVDYKYCSEEEPLLIAVQFPKGEALLFKDSIPEELKQKLESCWTIIFDSKTYAAYISYHGHYQFDGYTMPVNGAICNFPDFAKAWDIPKNGCKVFFEGIAYMPTYGGTTNQILIDYVLTRLIK